MKEKGWIRKNENGMITITVEGVDRVSCVHHDKIAKKLLTDRTKVVA
jgi:hypothetical protein